MSSMNERRKAIQAHLSERETGVVSDGPITYRLGLHSLDSAAANFKFQNGNEHLAVSMSPDRYREMGRPGWIEVVISHAEVLSL